MIEQAPAFDMAAAGTPEASYFVSRLHPGYTVAREVMGDILVYIDDPRDTTQVERIIRLHPSVDQESTGDITPDVALSVYDTNALHTATADLPSSTWRIGSSTDNYRLEQTSDHPLPRNFNRRLLVGQALAGTNLLCEYLALTPEARQHVTQGKVADELNTDILTSDLWDTMIPTYEGEIVTPQLAYRFLYKVLRKAQQAL